MLKIVAGKYLATVDEKTGAASLEERDGGSVIFRGAVGAARLNAEKKTLRTADADEITVSQDGSGARVECFFREMNVLLVHEIAALEGADGVSFALRLVNRGRHKISDVDYYPLLLERGKGGFLFSEDSNHDFRFLRNGMLTWSDCRVYKMDERQKGSRLKLVHDAAENAAVSPPGGRGHFIGEWYCAVRDNTDGSIVVAGFPRCVEQLGQISFRASNGFFRHFKAVSHGEGGDIAAGGEGRSLELAVIVSTGAEAARPMGFDATLKSFARLSAQKTPPPALPENPVGWCSWYYYFHDMSEKVIVDNIEAMAESRDEIPVKLAQVDDGYQPAVGDWLVTTSKFPNGMKWMAEKIRESGFEPGVWLAPFMVTDRSTIYKEHKDWLVKGENGKPRFITLWTSPFAPGRVYGVDLTHPEAREWLRDVFRTFVHEWGYKYLKLDFLYAGAIDGIRYDSTLTRAQALRSGLELVRETVGDDVFILGCGIPLSVGQGVVNGARISGDTAPFWHDKVASGILGHKAAPGVKNASRVLMTRYFHHRNFYLSDPDCLMARFSNTKLSGAEVLTHATVVAMMGGPLFISDNMMKTTEDSTRLAQRLIPPVDTPAVPADLFDSPMPSLLVMKFDGGASAVAARINWEDDATDMHLSFDQCGLDPDREYHVYELWEDRYHGIQKGHAIFSSVPAHASRLAAIRPVLDAPHVIATTFHFTMGGADMTEHSYDEAANKLRIKIEAPGKREGRVYFHVPDGFAQDVAIIDRAHATVLTREFSKFHYMELQMDGGAEIEIEFKRTGN